jgi:pimeloyl-ACP methyl ester carboxylesterase
MEGRAADVYAAVQSIQHHPRIDANNIGLIGHSQGGWVVTQTAADHPDVAFFISLAGPTTTMLENSSDNSYHFGRCQGMQGKELDEYIAKRLRMVNLSISIGELTNFGYFGFDARNMGYDPREAIRTVRNPGLFVYAENDDQVSPTLNVDRMNDIFDDDMPEHLTVVVIDNATHAFRLVNDPCESWVDVEEQVQSEQLTEVLEAWLVEQGY